VGWGCIRSLHPASKNFQQSFIRLDFSNEVSSFLSFLVAASASSSKANLRLQKEGMDFDPNDISSLPPEVLIYVTCLQCSLLFDIIDRCYVL